VVLAVTSGSTAFKNLRQICEEIMRCALQG
jgi:hypothetical protein